MPPQLEVLNTESVLQDDKILDIFNDEALLEDDSAEDEAQSWAADSSQSKAKNYKRDFTAGQNKFMTTPNPRAFQFHDQPSTPGVDSITAKLQMSDLDSCVSSATR